MCNYCLTYWFQLTLFSILSLCAPVCVQLMCNNVNIQNSTSPNTILQTDKLGSCVQTRIISKQYRNAYRNTLKVIVLSYSSIWSWSIYNPQKWNAASAEPMRTALDVECPPNGEMTRTNTTQREYQNMTFPSSNSSSPSLSRPISPPHSYLLQDFCSGTSAVVIWRACRPCVTQLPYQWGWHPPTDRHTDRRTCRLFQPSSEKGQWNPPPPPRDTRQESTSVCISCGHMQGIVCPGLGPSRVTGPYHQPYASRGNELIIDPILASLVIPLLFLSV